VTKFSLIVATFNRTVELNRLLNSLDQQSYKCFEVIVVDQNLDDRLVPMLQKHPELKILHLRSKLGVSRARNAGLSAADGDLIATPDDDCWYPSGLLANVNQWFDSHPDYDALFTGLRNESNQPMLPKWPPPAGPCTKGNVWDCTMASTAFLSRQIVDAVGGFDENLGLGPASIFKACEDIDYHIRPLAFGFRMWYEPGLTVYHPELDSPERLRSTTYPYALACGYVMRLHQYSWWFLLRRLLRSLGGAGLSVVTANMGRAKLYLIRFAGQFRGYVFGPSYVKRLAQSRSTVDDSA